MDWGTRGGEIWYTFRMVLIWPVKWVLLCLCAITMSLHFLFSSMVCLRGRFWGLIWFALYMLPLGHITDRHAVSFHFYADDMQIYLPSLDPQTQECWVHFMWTSLCDVKSWMSKHFLQLNSTKQRSLSLGPSTWQNKFCLRLVPYWILSNPVARNSGVSSTAQSLCNHGFYHLTIYLNF